ncbi:hypothetical protein MJO28_009075 [Puccinia striiformis f. sp. tritici]|uniref:Uncharacterized protein n=1 Tax=Puccinia striiformis f. sp. tritici TaxID=168172 RepID=A0ACC0E7I3_9BASI|nr:hypothetical protein MJO28_009075 [Puccinia striiformis f. sp. tritici]
MGLERRTAGGSDLGTFENRAGINTMPVMSDWLNCAGLSDLGMEDFTLAQAKIWRWRRVSARYDSIRPWDPGDIHPVECLQHGYQINVVGESEPIGIVVMPDNSFRLDGGLAMSRRWSLEPSHERDWQRVRLVVSGASWCVCDSKQSDPDRIKKESVDHSSRMAKGLIWKLLHIYHWLISKLQAPAVLDHCDFLGTSSTIKLSSMPRAPKMSMKRRMSDPDCKEFYDDAPLFLGSNPRGQTQLSLEDVWGHHRSDETGPEGTWKRPRHSKGRKVGKPAKTSKRPSSTHLARSVPKPEPNSSSSIDSRTPSDASLFSIESLWSKSNLSDGFNDLDFGFDPSLFPLEVDPIRGIHPSWLEPLKSVLIQPEIISLHQQLGPKYLGYDYKLGEKSPLPQAEVLPPPQHLYNWSRLTPLDQVKVVILGDRPHIHSDQIHGLAFSQPTECTHLSGVIGCIHRALENQYPDKFVSPDHGSLVSWCQAGVLLLNITQTTRRDNGTAHAKFGWREFTAKILEIVSRDGGSIYNDSSQPASHTVQKGIVFIGWGDEAIQAIESAGIASASRQHQILTSRGAPYPSSAYKDGFFGKNHFIQANEFLRTTYGDEHTIDWWSLDP